MGCTRILGHPRGDVNCGAGAQGNGRLNLNYNDPESKAFRIRENDPESFAFKIRENEASSFST